ncbi:MAG: ClpXP protease specificity-enhancing factor [Proteobacteria bacterium]|nr:ClpXP protease specificity-enhancing factor [Pseudomonadota bacterium]
MSPAGSDAQGSSTRPYLLRALHDWCTDNGFTPYIAVQVDASVQVPPEYVKDHEIVLNIGFEATSGLDLGNEFIAFKARFGGVAREIVIPVDHVVAIYARENGQGMAFPMASEASEDAAAPAEPGVAAGSRGLRLATSEVEGGAPDTTAGEDRPQPAQPPAPTEPTPPGGGRPTLKRIK